MDRIYLTNSNGWFNASKARQWDESTWHNGQNYISNATNSQWDHERLYRTASGNWVLNWWSQWQGSRETYERIDEFAAVQWLIRNDHADDILDSEPDSGLAKYLREKLADSEV